MKGFQHRSIMRLMIVSFLKYILNVGNASELYVSLLSHKSNIKSYGHITVIIFVKTKSNENEVEKLLLLINFFYRLSSNLTHIFTI